MSVTRRSTHNLWGWLAVLLALLLVVRWWYISLPVALVIGGTVLAVRLARRPRQESPEPQAAVARAELAARQDHSHGAIAEHLAVPQRVVDKECQALAQSSGSVCPHPRA
jgi:ribose 1,5-bisphosphokinase PhnN